MNKNTILSMAVVATIATTFTSCGSIEKQILKYLDNKEYDSAVEAYNLNELKEKQMSNLKDELVKRIDKSVTSYANNELDYDSVTGLISAIYKMRISEIDEQLMFSSTKLAEIKISKDAFENGNKAMTDGNYLEAYSYFKNVIQDDINYKDAEVNSNTALENFKISLVNEVDSFTKDNQYDAAISYLEICRYSVDSDEILKLIDDKISDVEVKKSEYELKKINDYADELINSGSYDEAIEYLNTEKSRTNSDIVSIEVTKKLSSIKKTAVVDNASKLRKNGDYEEALEKIKEYTDEYGSEDTDISSLKSEISDEYVALIMEKVTLLCNDENYIKALIMLENAQQIVNAEEFRSMVNKINEIKPTYIYDLKVSESARYELIDSGDKIIDTVGNVYDVGNLYEISTYSGGWSTENGYANYFLGYKYSRFHGTIAIDDKSDAVYGTITFYGDDSVIQSVSLNRTTAPVPIDIDISNVNWLKIELTHDQDDGTLYAILANCIVEK